MSCRCLVVFSMVVIRWNFRQPQMLHEFNYKFMSQTHALQFICPAVSSWGGTQTGNTMKHCQNSGLIMMSQIVKMTVIHEVFLLMPRIGC